MYINYVLSTKLCNIFRDAKSRRNRSHTMLKIMSSFRIFCKPTVNSKLCRYTILNPEQALPLYGAQDFVYIVYLI